MKRVLLLAIVISVLAFSLSGVVVASDYFDFGGATIRIMAMAHHPGSRFLEGDFTGGERYGTAIGLHEEAEKLFNCKIEFAAYGWGEWPPLVMSRILSGDAEHDLFIFNHIHYWQLLPQGPFFPVNDVLGPEYFETLPGMPKGMSDYMSFAGERYAFGSIGGAVTSLALIVYDKEVFASLGLPDPQELYFAGEWTWDAMFDIARNITADTTGDGEIDRWGLSGLGRREYMMPLVYTNAGAAALKEVDGQMVFTGQEPEFLDAVNTIAELIAQGVIDGRNRINSYEGVREGNTIMAVVPLGRLDQMDPDHAYSIVPLPMGPAASDYVHSSMWIDTALLLPVNSRNPEGMVQLAEFLYSRDDYYDIVDEMIRKHARDRVSAQIVWEMHDNWSGYVMPVPPPLEAAYQGVDAALRGEKTIAAAMAEVASSVQAGLDELFGQ